MTARTMRPVERVVLRMSAEGLAASDIAWRLRRTPGYVDRVKALASVPRPSPRAEGLHALRPVERCVLRARQDGVDVPEIAARLRRSPDYVARVVALAQLKLDQRR